MDYKWTVLAVTSIGVLMSGIDARIVIVGLPQVALSLHADAEQAIWFTQSYVLGSTIALLFIGRVTDTVGRVKIYNAGFAVFTAGSLLTSLSLDPAQVILFRGIQGLGSAILFTNSAALIVDATPRKELGFSLGINQVALRLGAMAGLTLSGLILSFFDWRALFYINVPIGIFGTYWSRRRLREVIELGKGSSSMDWAGFALFLVSMTSLMLALTYAAYGLEEALVVDMLFALSLATFLLFVWQERRSKDRLLDLGLMKIREFSGGAVAQLLNSMSWGAVLLLLSLYLQLVRDMTPLQAGLAIIPVDVAFLLFGPLSGRLSDRFGHLPFTTSGLAIQAVALFLFSTESISTPFPLVVLYMMLFGAGLGIFSSPNMSSIMGSVPPERRGIASAVRATFFNVGLTVSLNLAVVIMTFVVPYRIVSTMISSAPSLISQGDKLLFVAGLQHTYFWLATLNVIAIAPSMLRGKGRTERVEPGEVLEVEG